MNGTHTGAFELARRFRLRVARMSSVSSEVEYVGGGGVAPIDPDLEELALDDGPRGGPRGGAGRALGVARTRDSIDDFDPDDLIGNRVAHGSPAPSRPPQRPNGYAEDQFDMDFEPSSSSTRQMSPEHAEALANHPGDELDDPVIVDRPPPRTWNQPDPYGHQAAYRAVDAQLDDDALGHDIDSEVAAELANSDLSFDPDDARAFDAAVPSSHKGTSTAPNYVNGFDDTELPSRAGQLAAAVETTSHDYVDESLAVSGSYDPYGTEAVQTPPYDPTLAHVVDTSQAELEDPLAEQPRAESGVEDDLDEADFYASQGMYQEALDVLHALYQRHPNHRLILVKLREVEALAGGIEDVPSVATEALDLDEIQEVSADDLEEMDSVNNVAPAKKKRAPTVMLEKPVDESDAETHYDLGLAYKEMGLVDEAMKAFEKALRAPGREVGCRVMIGMCLRDQGNPTEAINQFKAGLHAEPTDRERQSIYYEIGNTYESIGDVGEALYYFEMVAKRDPSFADAGQRVQQLRAQGTRPQHADDDI